MQFRGADLHVAKVGQDQFELGVEFDTRAGRDGFSGDERSWALTNHIDN
jgi:hypothetical protein